MTRSVYLIAASLAILVAAPAPAMAPRPSASPAFSAADAAALTDDWNYISWLGGEQKNLTPGTTDADVAALYSAFDRARTAPRPEAYAAAKSDYLAARARLCSVYVGCKAFPAKKG